MENEITHGKSIKSDDNSFFRKNQNETGRIMHKDEFD